MAQSTGSVQEHHVECVLANIAVRLHGLSVKHSQSTCGHKRMGETLLNRHRSAVDRAGKVAGAEIDQTWINNEF